MASRFRLIILPVLVIFVLVAVAVTVNRLRGRSPSKSAANNVPAQPISLPRPAARDDRFVGSEVCAECHKQIFEQFKVSPMGRSMATIADAAQVEDYDATLVTPSEHRQYRITRDGNSVTHDEVLVDEQGDAYWEQSEPIDFVVGSGKSGRAYLLNRDGLLFQSPIGWYEHSQCWDLSPGYSPEHHARFSRRIGDGCLYCHAGRMHNQGPSTDRYVEPVFAELAIGCERCHGPGDQHVRIHSAAASVPLEDTIVNPADLPVSKRESVCNQCHLIGRSVIRRYGRQFFDFRPGDDLEDIFVVLPEEMRGHADGRLKAVNQVEQMRASQCYKASDGQLGCVSCHDPHSTPTPEQRDEHYRLRCLACHETKGCSLDLASRQIPPANNSCIHCHMPALPGSDVPHTSFTDHRILREPRHAQPEHEQAPDLQASLTNLMDAHPGLPVRALERARGIALMTMAWKRNDDYLASEALSHLLQAAGGELNDRLGTIDDLSVLEELASGYLLLRNSDLSERCWTRVLELNPYSESAVMGLAKIAEARQDLARLGDYLGQSLALNPTNEGTWALLVKQRHYSDDPRGAIQAAERLLEINPLNFDMRTWLISAYQRQGETEKAELHQAFLLKSRPLKQAEASRSSDDP